MKVKVVYRLQKFSRKILLKNILNVVKSEHRVLFSQTKWKFQLEIRVPFLQGHLSGFCGCFSVKRTCAMVRNDVKFLKTK